MHERKHRDADAGCSKSYIQGEEASIALQPHSRPIDKAVRVAGERKYANVCSQ